MAALFLFALAGEETYEIVGKDGRACPNPTSRIFPSDIRVFRHNVIHWQRVARRLKRIGSCIGEQCREPLDEGRAQLRFSAKYGVAFAVFGDGLAVGVESVESVLD